MVSSSMKKIVTLAVTIVTIGCLLVNSGCWEKHGRDKIVIRWTGYSYPVYDKFREEESKKFEKLHPDILVKYEPITSDYKPKLLTQIAGGNAPDLFFIPMRELIRQ